MSSRILVIDDGLIALRGLKGMLAHEEYTMDSCGTKSEAATKLNGTQYDLVVTDLDPAARESIEFVKLLRKSSPAACVVLMAKSPSREQIRKALALKIEFYLPYNSPPSLIRKTISRALQKTTEKHVGVPPQEEWSPEILRKLDDIIARNRKKPGSLISVLQMAQEITGYLPPSILRHIAKGMRIPESEVHGVVSFYSLFTMKPRGKHNIRVCLGTACYVKAAEEIISTLSEGLQVEVGGMTSDRKFSLETVRCLGACGLAPVVVVDKDTYCFINHIKALDILKDYE
jgi:NADH:ubiquinone oxidoreductase subunit E/CheY-like chemotaxis protein